MSYTPGRSEYVSLIAVLVMTMTHSQRTSKTVTRQGIPTSVYLLCLPGTPGCSNNSIDCKSAPSHTHFQASSGPGTRSSHHTPSIAFRHLPPEEGRRKRVLGVCPCTTLRASLSGTFLQRKDLVNLCLEYVRALHRERRLQWSGSPSVHTVSHSVFRGLAGAGVDRVWVLGWSN